MKVPQPPFRKIVHRTRGQVHGPVTRLMSPGDLGQVLKPFIFFDLVTLEDTAASPFDLHPHSGIGTITVLTDGEARFDDGEGNTGTIGFGGVEWMRAGRGVWHGRELGPGTSRGIQGFQLWLSLPPELELSIADGQYLEADCIPQVGPAKLILGRYGGEQSPVRAPAGVNYLLIRLKAGERWRYDTPPGHTKGFVSVARGHVDVGGAVGAGEFAVLDPSDAPVIMHASEEGEVVLVLGTAEPHEHDLHLGHFSVHTTSANLDIGERNIRELRSRVLGLERRQGGRPVPVLR